MEEFGVMRDGLRVYGKIAYPEGEGPFPLVVFSHGFAASRVYDGGMPADFTAHGIAFAAFDFCGGGLESQSDGERCDMSVLTEAADLEAVLDYVLTLDKVDSERVFLVGSSQGGYVSSYVAASRPADVRALVLFFPAFCIGDDVSRRLEEAGYSEGDELPEQSEFGGLPIGRRYIQDALDVDIFGRIGDYDGDVLIVHGALDEIVPPAYSERALQVYGDRARLVMIDGMTHGFRFSPPECYHQAISLACDFIEQHS